MTVPAGTQLFTSNVGASEKLRTKLEIIQCSHCDLIQSIGDPVYYEHVSSSSSFVSEKLLAHRRGQISKLKTFSSKTIESLVDVGCGDGAILTTLVEPNISLLLGIEPTQKNVDNARAKGLRVQKCLVDEQTIFEKGPYDAVCSFHVMEHTTDIISVLKGIHRNLISDGIGLIEVPSTEAAIEKERIGDFMPDHINYFTAETMTLALNIAGFEVLECYRDWNKEHLVTYFKKRSVDGSLNFITQRTKKIKDTLLNFANKNRKIVVWGASHHMMPLFILFQEVFPDVTVIDNSTEKADRFIPGTKIKVLPVKDLDKLSNVTFIIGAPRFESEIISELEEKVGKKLKEDNELTKSLGFPVYET